MNTKLSLLILLFIIPFYPVFSSNVILTFDTVSGSQGQQVVIHAKVKNFTGILSMQGTIEFNPAVATFSGTEQYNLPGLNSSNFGAAQAGNGKVTFSWFDSDLSGESLADNSVVFALRFQLTGNTGQNSSVSLTSSVAAVEFVDITFNTVPYTTSPGLIQITGTGPGGVTIKADIVNTLTGTQVVVPVRVDNFTDIVSMQGTIEFDPAVASFMNVEQFNLSGLSAGNFGTTQTSTGKLTFSWSDQTLAGQTKPDNTALFAIRFNAAGNAGQYSDISFTNSVTPLEFVDTSLSAIPYNSTNGKVNITGNPSGTVTLIIDSIAAAPASQVVVPVRVKDFYNIISLQGTIQFDQSLVSYLSVEQFGLPGMDASSFGTSQTANGKLTFSWYDLTLAGQDKVDSSIIFAVKFTVNGTIGQHTDLNFINSPTPVEVIDSTFTTLSTVLQHGHIEILDLYGIFTGTITPLVYCVGSAIDVPFTIFGVFDSGNIFTAQLSDATGSFASPVDIGTLNGSNAGTIHATIPLITPAGTGYRIRIVSSSPVVTGTTNSSNISVYQYPVAEAGPNTAVCSGDTAHLLAGGGTIYQWSNGINTASNNVVTAGIYRVTVSNAGNCSSIDSVVVTVNPLPVANAGIDDTICIGTSATLTASGGTSYSWSTGETLQQITVSTNTTSDYIVTATDANNCSKTDTVVVTVITITAVAVPDTTVCQGSSVILHASGGNSYSWSTGETNPIIVVTPSASTIFHVTVTGANNCTDTDSVIVNILSLPNANAGSDTAVCFGNTAFLHASGGISYQWSNGVNVSQNPVTIADIYYVTVTGSNGCANKDTVIVTINPLPAAFAGSDTIICIGSTILLNATGGISYSWSTGENTQQISVNPVATADYSVTVTDANNCSNSDTVTVNLFADAAGAGSDTAICFKDTIQISAHGGSGYSWSTGETFQNISVSPSITTTYFVTITSPQGCSKNDSLTVTVLSLPIAYAGNDTSVCQNDTAMLYAGGGVSYLWSNNVTNALNPVVTGGAYIVTVTDMNACSNTDTVLITINPLPSAFAGNDLAICRYDTAILNASGGISYLWSTNENTQSISVSPDSSTAYQVTVFDILGCSDRDSVLVIVNYSGGSVSGDTAICTGDTATITATGGTSYSWNTGATDSVIYVTIAGPFSVTITGSNGCTESFSLPLSVHNLPIAEAGNNIAVCFGDTAHLLAGGGVTYFWNTGETTQGIDVSPASDVYYYVTVFDNIGCYSYDSILVTINPLPLADAGVDVTICRYDTAFLSATGGIHFVWSIGDTISTIYTVPFNTTEYIVTATDNNGCHNSDTVLVVVNFVDAEAGQDVTICNGDTAILLASGGTSYAWNTGDTISEISVTIAGIYFVTVTGSTGCFSTDSVTVNFNISPIAEAGQDTTICFGDTAHLTASGGVTYLWNNSDTTADIFITIAGIFYVTVYDSNGCTASDSIHLFVNPLPVANAGNDVSICRGNDTSLTATGGILYHWSTGEDLATISVAPQNTTDYMVTVTDGNGCHNSDTVSVVVYFVNASAGPDTTFCYGDTVAVFASGGITYLWNTGDTTNVINVSTGGVYYVTVTGANNCTAADSVHIIINQIPSIAGTPTGPTSVCTNDTTVTSYTTQGAPSATSYIWYLLPSSAGTITGDSLTAAVSWSPTYFGNVMLAVKGINACGTGTISNSLLVSVSPSPVITLSNDTTICVGNSVSLTASGGTVYQWSNGDNQPNIVVSPTSNTVFTVTVTNTSGCSSTDSIIVLVHPLPPVNLTPDTLHTALPATLDAGSGFDSYLWSTSESTQQISVNAYGWYFVTVGNIHGCYATDSIYVDDNVGILTMEQDDGFITVYPNPAKNKLTIEFSEILQQESFFEITDITGAVMTKKIIHNINKEIIDVKNLPRGVYLLKICKGDKRNLLKLILQ
ncbi:MAG: T9SS type A sorting domain-containing protein [Bacteroidia bacterium]|nr:T9SS type A sorting domain-containing protein [Bacteroidia bacterium]